MSKQPVHVIRFGLIKAAIWENNSQGQPRHTVSLCRLYKNGDQWKESSRFGRDDLLVLAKAADAAHSWIFNQRQGSDREAPQT